MKLLKYTVPGIVLAGGLLINTTTSFGKPEYTKKESGAKCTVCHVAMGKKDLNDTGKCYADKKSLKACASEKK